MWLFGFLCIVCCNVWAILTLGDRTVLAQFDVSDVQAFQLVLNRSPDGELEQTEASGLPACPTWAWEENELQGRNSQGRVHRPHSCLHEAGHLRGWDR